MAAIFFSVLMFIYAVLVAIGVLRDDRRRPAQPTVPASTPTASRLFVVAVGIVATLPDPDAPGESTYLVFPMVIAAQDAEDALTVARKSIALHHPPREGYQSVIATMDVSDKCQGYSFDELGCWNQKALR